MKDNMEPHERTGPAATGRMRTHHEIDDADLKLKPAPRWVKYLLIAIWVSIVVQLLTLVLAWIP